MLSPFLKHWRTDSSIAFQLVQVSTLLATAIQVGQRIYSSSILELGLTCSRSIGREVYPSDAGLAHNLAEYVFHILGLVPNRHVLGPRIPTA